MFRFIKQLIFAFVEEFRRYFDENFFMQDPKIRIKNQLRIMAGRGEISRERFFELLRRADWDQIGQGDVILLHREALMRMQAQGRLRPGGGDPEIERDLDRLYLDQGMLAELRSDVADKQRDLAREASWIRKQVEAARQGAQRALPDDAAARAYLEIWQHLSELSRRTEMRLRHLEDAAHRIDLLEADLRVSVNELNLLESRQQLSELNLRVRQDLLIQGQK